MKTIIKIFHFGGSKMKKRILSIILSVLICFTYFAPMSLLAENETIDGSIEIQDELIQEEVDTNDNLNEDLEDIVLHIMHRIV